MLLRHRAPPEQQSLVLLTIWKYMRSKADKTKQNFTLVQLNWVENNTSNFVSCVFICQLVNHFDNTIHISILSTHCIFKEYYFDGLVTSNNDQFCQNYEENKVLLRFLSINQIIENKIHKNREIWRPMCSVQPLKILIGAKFYHHKIFV